MWQEDDTINYSQSSEPSSPRPSTVATLPSSTLPANLISRPAAYTIGTKSRSYSNDPSTPSHAHLHHLPLRTHSHRKSTSVSSNASSTGTTGTAGTTGTGISTSRVTFADQVAFPPGQEPDLVLDEPSHFLEQQDTHTMDTKPALSVATDMAVSPPERSPLSSSSTSTTPHLTSPTLKRGLSRTSSLRSTPGSDSTTSSLPASATAVPGDASLPPSSLSRQSSLSLNLGRKSSMTKKSLSTMSDRDSVPPSPSSAHRGQRHVMLNRRSVSQDFSLRLQQQQQKQDDLGEELSEAGEDIPGTPSSVSSFGSASASVSTTASGRNRLNRNSVALIESRNQTLSSNLAMVSSPTDSEFLQQTSESLLSVIAQKEARIAQLREDLETNLSELTQLKERWSQMMMEERTRQQAEASASIQQQEEKLYGHSSAQSVSHRLSTTGAGLWGSVVGSVSGISGVSGGISLHNINSMHHHHHHHIPTEQEPISPKRSQSKGRINREGQRAQSPNRPTSPLPAYLSGFSSLNGLDSASTKGTTTGTSTRGDRASVSSLSTCSSSLSNDGPTAFEAGHSSQSSFSSAGGEHATKDRESRRARRESSGLFIPPEAEEVLVNTGRALFKGFGSLIGGIRTVVNDVAESDR
ncbi:hypothetical protein CPB97_011502 [Podila verticillata]|nr:hypothetical protein CPB97_011502 [Podila verticillata]